MTTLVYKKYVKFSILFGLLALTLLAFKVENAAAHYGVTTCTQSGPILINGKVSRDSLYDTIQPTSSIRYCTFGSNGLTAYQFDYFGQTLIGTRAFYSSGAVVLFNASGALKAIQYTGLTGSLSAYQFDYNNGIVVGLRSYEPNGRVTLFTAAGVFLRTISPGVVFTSLPY